MGTSKTTKSKWARFARAYVLSGCGVTSAEKAGYKGKRASLAVASSRLLKKTEVRNMIEGIQAELKGKPIPTPVPTTAPIPINFEVAKKLAEDKIVHHRMVVETEDKRALLWKIANICAEVEVNEDIQEEVDDDGLVTRIITRTERVFMPETAINAIDKMNQMDGDIQTPGAATGGLSIESLLLSIGR